MYTEWDVRRVYVRHNQAGKWPNVRVDDFH